MSVQFYWIPGPLANYGTTENGFKGEVRVVSVADFQLVTHANEVQAQEIHSLRADIVDLIAEVARLQRLIQMASDTGDLYERKLDAHETAIGSLRSRLAEAVECCTIKDNRNLWLEIRLKKIMARCADLLDEDQFNELDAIASSASVVQYKPCEICTTQSWCETHGCQCYPVSAVQPERCCLDYPRCDCNSPPEPDDAPTVQPCGHPWKAQHDFKCILCSSPGVTP